MSALMEFIKKRLNRHDTAQIAKERLQIIVAHERMKRDKNVVVNLPELQQKLIEVISTYLRIDKDQVNVELQRDENRSVLEMNVTLPEV